MKSMTQKAQAGFTLIELLIVVAIIGILAAIAVPAYQDYTIKAQVTEGANLAGGLKTSVAEYYHNHGTFPGDADINNTPANVTGKYVTQVDVTAGVISATFGGDANTNIAGDTFVLTPTDNSGSISWSCTASTIDAKYLPSSCK